MSNTIISFDVGMKNLAFCVLSKDDASVAPQILDWDVLNVITGSESASAAVPVAKVNVSCSLCKRKAMFVDVATSTKHFCTAHKTAEGHIVATAAYTPAKLLKQSKSALEEICKTMGIEYPTPILKADLVQQIIVPWLRPKLIEPLNKRSSGAANKPASSMVTTYIQMGRFMDTMLRERLTPFRDVTRAVIIENQMAERMHMIQGMLTQFCIGFFPGDVAIEFIGPSNKLKPVTMHPALEKQSVEDSAESKAKGGAKYRQNKKDGIQRCREWVDREYSTTQWKILYDKSTKKDDLADSYLQGLWYCLTKPRD